MPNGLLLPFTHTSFVRVFPSPLGSVWMWPIPKPPKLHVSIVSIFNLLSPDWISRFYYSCYWCLSTAASTRLFISSLKLRSSQEKDSNSSFKYVIYSFNSYLNTTVSPISTNVSLVQTGTRIQSYLSYRHWQGTRRFLSLHYDTNRTGVDSVLGVLIPPTREYHLRTRRFRFTNSVSSRVT